MSNSWRNMKILVCVCVCVCVCWHKAVVWHNYLNKPVVCQVVQILVAKPRFAAGVAEARLVLRPVAVVVSASVKTTHNHRPPRDVICTNFSKYYSTFMSINIISMSIFTLVWFWDIQVQKCHAGSFALWFKSSKQWQKLCWSVITVVLLGILACFMLVTYSYCLTRRRLCPCHSRCICCWAGVTRHRHLATCKHRCCWFHVEADQSSRKYNLIKQQGGENSTQISKCTWKGYEFHL